MLFKEIISTYSKNHTKPINRKCSQNRVLNFPSAYNDSIIQYRTMKVYIRMVDRFFSFITALSQLHLSPMSPRHGVRKMRMERTDSVYGR
jgi:hypothetical protein